MNRSQTQTLFHNPVQSLKSLYERNGGAYIFFITTVLIALEIFSFSTVKFALSDLLGDIGVGTATWAAILALAFCGMDLIGIIQLFNPQNRQTQGNEGWFLLGAWLLAAIMNTGLTWWGISLAIYNHPVQSVLVVDPMTIVTLIPIFVALMVLLIRILIIGNITSTIHRIHAKPGNNVQSANQPFGVRSEHTSDSTRFVRRSTVPQGTHVFSPRAESSK